MSGNGGKTDEDTVALKQRLAGLSASQRAELAHRLGKGKSLPLNSSAVIPRATPLRVEENPQGAVHPAAHGQQRMWFLQHYAPDSPVYCVPSAFHLTGQLDAALLKQALHAVARRHDILRTTFAMENGELFQRVAAIPSVELQLFDLEGFPAASRKPEADRILDVEVCRPFNLAEELPFRVAVIKLHSREHLMLLVLHHIISDGWSRSNFYRELSAAYRALAAGMPVPADELPFQLADHSAWQRDWMMGRALDAQTAYWKRKLEGELEPLDLPSDRPRPPTESFRGNRCSRSIDAELVATLGQRAQEEGATLFMISLAAFKTLLLRYTGQGDLIVGVPIANRQSTALESLIGYFANTLVMRTAVTGDITFRELLRRVKTTAVEAYEHQDMPFDRLVELLKVRRDASRTPLFQVSFGFLNFPAVKLDLPEIEAKPHPVYTHTSKFDLSLTMERCGDGWTAVAEYSTDLFDPDRIQRMLEHWCVILESVAASPDQRLSEIPLLTAEESQRMLVEWNRTERDYPQGECIHCLFGEQVRRTPDKVAIVFAGKHLTYRELNDRADRMALHLRSLGVGSDIPVGLCVERSMEMVVAALAILKAGGAYVPLDPSYPRERTEFIMQDADMRVLVTQRSRNNGRDGIRLVFADEAIPKSATDGAEVPAEPGNLAYVIYTSGSTGLPKGVAIEHRNAASFLRWVRDSFTDEELSGVLASTSICFDLSVFEIFGPLCWGGRVLLVDSALDLWSPDAPKDPSLINTVPSVLAELLRSHRLPPSIRTVNLAGEALRQPLVEEIFKTGSVEHVNDLYGPSETTTYSTWARRRPGDVENVGRPIANTQVYILDAHGRPAPLGTPGELNIGGAGVARGYWRRPELTAERFVPDPFSSSPNARMFRTGDRARWRADGRVELLGRTDSQVKLRGYRIELGEIETALRAQPEVREAVVTIGEAAPGDQRLHAHLVARDAGKADEAGLRARLAKTLPEYMLPGSFVWLDQLPVTPNGKVDRKALQVPDTPGGDSSGNKDQPVNLLEHELLRLWQRLFQCEDIGRHDNFFDLGGHSLLAARLATEIDSLLGCRLPIPTLFQSPTIATMAERITAENWAPPWASLVPLQPEGEEPPVFCIHGLYGEVFGYLHLARAFAPDRPVYGLQAVGLDGRTPRHSTMEEMAEHYAREIRSVQPEGPYHLIGGSLGGWFAYAVAQELTRQGCKVAILALLDTRGTPDLPWLLHFRTISPWLGSRFFHHLRMAFGHQETGRFHFLKQKLMWLRVHLTQSRKKLPVHAPDTKSPPSNSKSATLDYFHDIAIRYKPGIYRGDVTIFAGKDAKPFNHALLWKHFVSGRVKIIRVGGEHISLISETHAPGLAEAFKQALRETQNNG